MQRKPINVKNYQPTSVIKTQIVLHYSERTVDQQRQYFNESETPQGCALMVGQNGIVYIMFNPAYYTNHIGGKNLAAEMRSIGVILEAKPTVRKLRGEVKTQYFTLTQLKALRELCKKLRERFKIKGEAHITKRKCKNAIFVRSGIYLRDSFGHVDEFPKLSVKELNKVFKR